MADLVAIRNALADRITQYSGLRAQGQAHDSITPPCAVILPGNPIISYADTMDGAVTINLVVLVIVSDGAPVEATQRALDTYLGVGEPGVVTVPEAIEQDNTLSGLVHFIQAQTATGYGRIEYSGIVYFGARINCIVGAI